MTLADVLIASLGIAMVVDVVIGRLEAPWVDSWNFFFGIFSIAAAVLVAAWCWGQHDTGGVVVWLIIAAGEFLTWWRRNKRKRRRMAERATGFVVDAGGRLRVVQVAVE